MFKKIGEKVAVVLGVIMSIAGFIFYFFQRKPSVKNLLEEQLGRVTSEIEIANIEVEKDKNIDKIKILQDKEAEIRGKIKEIENGEISEEDVSIEELDSFFDKRGF